MEIGNTRNIYFQLVASSICKLLGPNRFRRIICLLWWVYTQAQERDPNNVLRYARPPKRYINTKLPINIRKLREDFK